MIKIIIEKFVENSENTKDKKVRENYIKLSGVLGVLCNLLVFVAKILMGVSVNSIAIISDAFNNLTDIGSSVISIVSAKLSNRPPDKEHPHGHGRYEYIGSLIVAVIIIGVGFSLLFESIDRLINPVKIDFSYYTLVILVLSVLVKLWMFSYNKYISKKINSSINKAASYDSLSDSIATSLVIFSMIAGMYTDFPIDGLMGVLISFLIMYSGIDVIRDTISLLLGSVPDGEVVEKIRRILNEDKFIIAVHDLEIHDYGPGRTIASVHAEIDDTTNIVDGHRAIDYLEKKIQEQTDVELTIHIDPVSTDKRKLKKVRKDIDNLLEEEGIDVRIVNFRIAHTTKNIIVMFNMILGENSNLSYEETKKDIKEKIESKFDNYKIVINDL
ncbi:MAG: cation diffusion facilitator family transporter [Halanaerobiales bacterium]